jgi:hypothetical protein
LTLTDRIAPLKQLFMERALGLSDDLPPLARPLRNPVAHGIQGFNRAHDRRG